MRYFWIIICAVITLPAIAATDSCIECHRDWPEYTEWKGSSHNSAGVTCIDCHGGDTSAMSMDGVRASASYVDLTDKRNVPGVCANCHSDFQLMKQYGLPTDQMEQYMTSRHGDRLINFGDTNVASCADCHGAHAVLPADDSTSRIYRLNIPGVCAECHSDKDLMAIYSLPADTYDKYAASYHGEQLLQNQITGAAVCVDCHGNHGAAPPGVTEIRNVCGQCHINQEEYFKKSPHAAGTITETTGASDCAACHNYHDIKRPTHDKWVSDDTGDCAHCHEKGTVAFIRGEKILKSITDAEATIEEVRALIDEAAHSGIFTEELEAELKEAETSLTEAYPAAHSLDLNTVTEKTKASLETAHNVELQITDFQKELKKRRNILIGVVAFIAVLLLILEIKRRIMFRKLAKSETDNG